LLGKRRDSQSYKMHAVSKNRGCFRETLENSLRPQHRNSADGSQRAVLFI
jgi:hypothetical protein